jgi:hypothetical protein
MYKFAFVLFAVLGLNAVSFADETDSDLPREGLLPDVLTAGAVKSAYQKGVGTFTLVKDESGEEQDFKVIHDPNECNWNRYGEVVNCTKRAPETRLVRIEGLLMHGKVRYYVAIDLAKKGTAKYFKILYNTKTKVLELMDSDLTHLIDPHYNLRSSILEGASTFKVRLE